MAGTSAPTSKFKKLELSGSCTTSGSKESALASKSGRRTTSASLLVSAFGAVALLLLSFSFFSGTKKKKTASGKPTNISEREEQIERSKVHWSELSEHAISSAFSSDEEEVVAEVDNIEVFKDLQSHPQWGSFFLTFGYGLGNYGSSGELEVGDKFAEGGQAELFHAKVTWRDPKITKMQLEEGLEFVLKVFKKGTSLRHLQLQLPHGYLHWWVQNRADNLEEIRLGIPASTARYHCEVDYGTLLKDGRFAFLMVKEEEDLRSLIDRSMETSIGKIYGPFQRVNEEAQMIMYRIALGMNWLHNRNIVHRDLKASNVLMRKHRVYGTWICSIADFECSVGVIGTGFWRAPEILQAIKEKKVLQRPAIFSKEADVYAYGMTCYEILTGKIPFASHPVSDYDIVLNGQRPEVPNYVDDWAHGLLNWCWQSDPGCRPSFGDILKLLSTFSARIRRYIDQQKY